MITLRKPRATRIRRFIASEQHLDFTYPLVGATAGWPPPGFDIDRNRIRLGAGPNSSVLFDRACEALRQWRMFDLGWVEAIPGDTPIEPGATVAILMKIHGLYWLNSARIVYTIDEDGPMRRFGFAYGTLPGHAEAGEERFMIEWNRASGEVSYQLFAFSRPRHPLARLGYPLARMLQRRFVRDSQQRMRSAVARKGAQTP